MNERLAFLDREVLYWSAQLALDERGAAACRAKLDQLEAERAAIAEREHILPRSARLAERLGVR